MTVASDEREGTGGKTVVGLLRERTGIHHEAHGQGAPILLTHGFGATTRMWDEQIEVFSDRYRLIAWDLPGHGRTETRAAETHDRQPCHGDAAHPRRSSTRTAPCLWDLALAGCCRCASGARSRIACAPWF